MREAQGGMPMRERVRGKPGGDAHAGSPGDAHAGVHTRSYAGRLLLSSGNDQKGARMWQKVHPPSEAINCE